MSKIDLQKLVTHGRDGWQLPDQIVKMVRPEPGPVVALTGAGEGYFDPSFRPVAPINTVYAVEANEQVIKDLRTRVEAKELSNVEAIQGTFDDSGLPVR